jgi:hypothetical protein
MHNLDDSPLVESAGRPLVLLREVCRIILAQEKLMLLRKSAIIKNENTYRSACSLFKGPD